MLAAIEFDDQFLFKTDEINDISPDWLLSSEFILTQLTHSEMFPKKPFCVSCFSSQCSRVCDIGKIMFFYHIRVSFPSPWPSPSEGRGDLLRKKHHYP